MGNNSATHRLDAWQFKTRFLKCWKEIRELSPLPSALKQTQPWRTLHSSREGRATSSTTTVVLDPSTMPSLAQWLTNQGMCWENQPQLCIKMTIKMLPKELRLKDLEQQLIARTLLFLKIKQLPKTLMKATVDNVINVPLECNDISQNILFEI